MIVLSCWMERSSRCHRSAAAMPLRSNVLFGWTGFTRPGGFGDMPPLLPRRRFTVDDYYRMVRAGILHEDDRVELLDGEIIEMSPTGSRHAATVNRLVRLYSAQAADRYVVSVQ